jgi:hypothetical protein
MLPDNILTNIWTLICVVLICLLTDIAYLGLKFRYGCGDKDHGIPWRIDYDDDYDVNKDESYKVMRLSVMIEAN